MHSILLAILLAAAAGCQAPASEGAQAAVPKAAPIPEPPARAAAPQADSANARPPQPPKEAPAQPAPQESAKADRAWQFLDPAAVDLTALIEPPPKPASAEHAKDESILLWLQERRTPEDEARAWRSLSFDLTWFDEAIGARLDPTWSGELFNAFRWVRNGLTSITQDLPESFKRDRPHANPMIKPCLPREDEITVGGEVIVVNGYPSGPVLRATVFAALLSNLFEDRKDALMARAREVGYARTLGGVNYPSDVRAAEQLGAALARQIIAGEEWSQCKVILKEDLTRLAARRELQPSAAEAAPKTATPEPEPAPVKVPEPGKGSPE